MGSTVWRYKGDAEKNAFSKMKECDEVERDAGEEKERESGQSDLHKALLGQTQQTHQ